MSVFQYDKRRYTKRTDDLDGYGIPIARSNNGFAGHPSTSGASVRDLDVKEALGALRTPWRRRNQDVRARSHDTAKGMSTYQRIYEKDTSLANQTFSARVIVFSPMFD